MTGAITLPLSAETYVMTAAEVALHFFRRGPDFLRSAEFKKRYPSFPAPRLDGLFHRRSIEHWTDLTFGIADEPRSHRQLPVIPPSKTIAPEWNGFVPRAFSPATLAKRWQCTDNTIRNLVRRGELEAFNAGKLIRISLQEVERYEAKSDGGPKD